MCWASIRMPISNTNLLFSLRKEKNDIFIVLTNAEWSRRRKKKIKKKTNQKMNSYKWYRAKIILQWFVWNALRMAGEDSWLIASDGVLPGLQLFLLFVLMSEAMSPLPLLCFHFTSQSFGLSSAHWLRMQRLNLTSILTLLSQS